MNLAKILLIAAFLKGAPLYAEILFENSTEDSTAKWAAASGPITDVLIATLEDRDVLENEMREKGYRIGRTKILAEKKIALSDSPGVYRFVRPATSPYVSYFYGAHNFQYWFMADSKVLFSSRSDKVTVLSSGRHGMKDIVVSNFSAAGRYWQEIKYAYGKDGYTAVSCRAYEAAKPEKRFACTHEFR
ncbi:hypothetical protein [Pseudacidovorax intermedius]|uniref:hypothetical protein n=1 Tax=Pseudacidovorax intermedius TaxID=433924 RepID=UPI0011C07D71|nr:hypothetical protein [Pseudacidovorax intermedius]